MRHLCLVKITADDGTVGWGESITQFPEASLATREVINGMAQEVVGRNVLHTEAIWRALKDKAWWYGYRGGISSYGIAAIDIALWDLKGKALETSVCDLLGGPVHDRLPAIACSHAHDESIPEMAAEAASWMGQGFQGMKVGFGKRGHANLGYDHSRDIEYVKAMRDTIGSAMLMIDLGIKIKWDVAAAIQRAQAFEEYGVDWIEEPLGAWDPDGYRDLRTHTNIRLAYGEKEWTLDGYEEVLRTGTVDVVGVDPGRAEGITGFKKVCDRVEYYGRNVNAHAWSSAICSGASLAVSFSTSASRLFEFKPLDNPMQHELVEEPFAHQDGWVLPPVDKPGLGIEVIEEVVDRYRSG